MEHKPCGDSAEHMYIGIIAPDGLVSLAGGVPNMMVEPTGRQPACDRRAHDDNDGLGAKKSTSKKAAACDGCRVRHRGALSFDALHCFIRPWARPVGRLLPAE